MCQKANQLSYLDDTSKSLYFYYYYFIRFSDTEIMFFLFVISGKYNCKHYIYIFKNNNVFKFIKSYISVRLKILYVYSPISSSKFPFQKIYSTKADNFTRAPPRSLTWKHKHKSSIIHRIQGYQTGKGWQYSVH
jgi:hypothetical protein